MNSNSLYYIKASNKYMTYQNRGKGSEKIANLPEMVSSMYMYQKAHKVSAVSKLAMLRPDLVRYLECFQVFKSHFVTDICRHGVNYMQM